MPKLGFTERQVSDAIDLLYAVATEREGFTFSGNGRQQMMSTANNLSWLLRQVDFRKALTESASSDPEIVTIRPIDEPCEATITFCHTALGLMLAMEKATAELDEGQHAAVVKASELLEAVSLELNT